MVLNIGQAFKMAWRSICGKKGPQRPDHSLSIFIGIAAVMTIVSHHGGMKAKTMEQFAAMGANRIEVRAFMPICMMRGGNPISKDYFTGLYRFCSGLKESIIGITPKGSSNATVVYGTKNSSTMEWKYDQQYNVVSGPPQIYYGPTSTAPATIWQSQRAETLRGWTARNTIRSACWARRRRGSFSAAPTLWDRS